MTNIYDDSILEYILTGLLVTITIASATYSHINYQKEKERTHPTSRMVEEEPLENVREVMRQYRPQRQSQMCQPTIVLANLVQEDESCYFSTGFTLRDDGLSCQTTSEVDREEYVSQTFFGDYMGLRTGDRKNRLLTRDIETAIRECQ
jgi:hypothetical protein